MTGGAGASSCSNGGGGTALSVVVRGAGSILTVCRGPPQTPVPLVMSPDSIHSYVHRDMTAESRTLSRLDSHNSRDQLPTTVGKGYMTKEREINRDLFPSCHVLHLHLHHLLVGIRFLGPSGDPVSSGPALRGDSQDQHGAVSALAGQITLASPPEATVPGTPARSSQGLQSSAQRPPCGHDASLHAVPVTSRDLAPPSQIESEQRCPTTSAVEDKEEPISEEYR
jgi:hypothetical protein